MGGILGGGGSGSSTGTTQANGLQIQTSANGLAIPIVYGQVKLAPNLFWYNDFAAIKQPNQQGGKGGSSGGSNSYKYQVAAMLGLCEGPIVGVPAVWADQTTTTLSALNMSLFTGAADQAVWGYLPTRHPDQALAYPSTAYVAVAPYDLGANPSLPNHNFEVQGGLWKTGAGSLYDADPSAMVLDFLTNPQYGLGFPAANIDLVSLQTGPASYQAYCQATGLWLSAALVDQEAARDTLTRWLQLTNSAAFWSGDTLKIVPYGDTPLTANGYSFTPDVTPIYDLDDDDYVCDGTVDPVIVTRKDPADCKNWVKLEILDRVNQYATDPIEAKDQAQIDLYGALPADQITAHEICDPTVGAISAQLILQRSVYIRNSYQFTLGWEYCLLEPMDIVTVTDALLGMARIPVRITSIEEDEKGNLTVNAEEFPAGIATATEYPKQVRTAYQPNYGVAPGSVNPPVIFEPSSDLAMGPPQVWVATSGGANWGGCSVHLSIDGATYTRIGEITLPARLGQLSSAIGAVADPDTTSVLSVSLAESPGATLASGTPADADAHRTLIYVDGELMAYAAATLTGVSEYGLTYLRRGLYGTAIAEHDAGGQFARLDGNLFEYDLPAAYVGQTIYLKFTSINIYGAAEEDISQVAVYSFVPTGNGGFIAPPTDLLISSTNRLAADGTALSTLIATWEASPGPLLAGYELDYRIHTVGGTNPWISAQIGQGATSWTLTPAVEGAVYDVQVRAISGLTPPTYSSYAEPQNSAAVAYDTTIPAVPTGLQAAASYSQVNVLWQADASPSVDQYELKAAQGAGATFANAATIYKGPATQYLHGGFNAGSIWTYWVAAISRAGNESAFSAPVIVNTPLGYDPSGILANSISSSQLVADLQSQIALITDPVTVPGSVAQVTQAAAQVTQAAVQNAGDMALRSVADVQSALETASGGILWLAGQLNSLSNAFRSAGFIIDPSSGALVYNAINQVVTSTGNLITDVQQQLNASNASIQLKADAATVNSQLAALIAGNQPILSDLFQGAADSWAMTGGNLTVNPASITTLSTGAAPLLAKTGLSIAGNTYNQVVMVVRRLDAGTDWLGTLQYSTAGHGYSATYQAAVPVPTGFGAFQTLTWDMSGIADWGASTITGLQFALSNANGDSFEIQSIQVTKNVVQQLLVSGLQGQITSAQLAISGLQAAVTQAASATTVNNQGVQIATLTTEVNALTGEISLKASQEDLTNLQTALTGTELVLDSLQGQITENIDAVTVPGAEEAGQAALAALVNQGNQLLDFQGAIAQARQELTAHTDNLTQAEAGQRTALTAVVNATSAALTIEAKVRASADAATTSLLTQLQATVAGNSAAATQQIQAVANSASTLSQELTTLTAGFNGNLAGLQTSISATATSASTTATQLQTLTAGFGGNLAGLQTSVSATTSQAGATAAELATLTAGFGGNLATLQNSVTATANSASTTATQLQTLTAGFGGNLATLQNSVTATANSASTTASQLQTLTAGFGGNLATLQGTVTLTANSASTTATQLATLTAGFGGNLAALQNQVTLTANSASTSVTDISHLQTSVGQNTANITALQNSVGGVQAEYTIQTEVDSHGVRYIAGIGLLANASGTSQVTILANDFLVAGLNTDGSLNPVAPFEVVNGQIQATKAVIGTITADQIAANTTYAGNLFIGNGQLLLHGQDDGNGNGPYFRALDGNNVTRALIGRLGNDWGIWVWNSAGNNVLSADGIGVNAVTTGAIAQFSASGMSGATTAGAQAIPIDGAWHDVQVTAFTTVSGATGVAITYSAELLDLYADPNAPYGGNNDAGGGNGGGGDGGDGGGE